ncbi:MAG TPA: hypothetical protein VLA24_15720 [Pseudomonadales bacterium]|nr:hypothetical protein [Pseudomonadales bacterium]
MRNYLTADPAVRATSKIAEHLARKAKGRRNIANELLACRDSGEFWQMCYLFDREEERELLYR